MDVTDYTSIPYLLPALPPQALNASGKAKAAPPKKEVATRRLHGMRGFNLGCHDKEPILFATDPFFWYIKQMGPEEGTLAPCLCKPLTLSFPCSGKGASKANSLQSKAARMKEKKGGTALLKL